MKSESSTIRLFGFDFSTAEDVEAVAVDMMEQTPGNGVDFLITPNSSMIVYYNERRNRELKSFYHHSRYILADGMPIVWIAGLKGMELRRLTGSDLFPVIWQKIREANVPAVFVVANQQLADRLSDEHSVSRFIIPRMFAASDDVYIDELASEIANVAREINAGFVFLGLGFPKQEKLGMQVGKKLRTGKEHSVLILLIGASFEFYFGQKVRAPQWMQSSGLEWLHRFLQEPGRLWKRYTVDIVRFVKYALQELLMPAKKS